LRSVYHGAVWRVTGCFVVAAKWRGCWVRKINFRAGLAAVNFHAQTFDRIRLASVPTSYLRRVVRNHLSSMAAKISPDSIAPIPMIDEKNPTNIAAVNFGASEFEISSKTCPTPLTKRISEKTIPSPAPHSQMTE
jgi:hypothetical protein